MPWRDSIGGVSTPPGTLPVPQVAHARAAELYLALRLIRRIAVCRFLFGFTRC